VNPTPAQTGNRPQKSGSQSCRNPDFRSPKIQ
jgi:hypothetical protein